MKLLPSRGCISAKCTFSRSGSALLVVLGMLSFMVISGLAFAVYMRTTRLSSSFTRRTVTTRQLAKAALAEAIDQIDRAVANDPHPGVRNPYRSYLATKPSKNNSSSGNSSSQKSTTDDFDPLKIDNVWSHRVLIGQVGSLNQLDSGVEVQVGRDTYYPEFADPGDTVPVLALEALAYLPPSLVNEVRYYGQRTPTAQWQSLDFDAGRFAYVAVDVSDFFDVNRFCAKLARSSDPMARVTLGHLFETDLNHENAGSNVSDWESFMGQYRTVGSDGRLSFGSMLPFVSLADFNLALGTRVKAGGLQSPFFEYFNQKNSSGIGFYIYSENSDDYERYSLMNFVTDSMLAARPQREMKTDDGKDVLNLADDSNQPFSPTFLETDQASRSLDDVARACNSSVVGKRWLQNRVPYVTMYNLSDYLDCDRIPVSLGIPSVERVPMICGVQPKLSGSMSFNVKLVYNRDTGGKTEVSGETETTRHMKRVVAWHLDEDALAAGFGAGSMLQALVVYPFRNHEQQNESSWFKLDGKLQLFLSTEPMPLRTGNDSDALHWGAIGDDKNGAKDGVQDNAVINLPLTAQTIDLTALSPDVKIDDLGRQCVTEVRFMLPSMNKTPENVIGDALKEAKGDLLNVTYEWDETRQDKNDPWVTKDNSATPAEGTLPGSYANITKSSSSFHALKADGTVDAKLSGIKDSISASFSQKLYLNLAVTLRVTSDNAEVKGQGSSGTVTVDMVPATIHNDELNGQSNSGGLSVDFFGSATPLMKFGLGGEFVLELKDPTPVGTVTPSPASVMINDPRYNHAPENWVAQSFTNPQDWYDNLAKASSQANDGDIFMASSDQGYLQSVYELALLPRCATLEPTGSSINGSLGTYDGSSRYELGAGTRPDGDLMWKTYDIFGRYNSNGGDDFDGLGIEYEGNGLRVNPYSNFDSVLMAAFANTPHDWRVASNNVDENPAGSSAMDNAATFNQKHAWNDYSSGASLCWDMLEDVAAQFRDRVRDGFTHPDNSFIYDEDKKYSIQSASDEYAPIWQDAFAKFFGTAAGNGAERTLCNIQLDNDCSSVYSVDKKFLYGYWKSCFAARQQLYLVFFRAEPMMLGGGVAGATPPQLGAKGVAVVWRDPYDPDERKSTGTVTRQYPTSSGNGDYIPHKTRILFYKQFE